MRTRFDRHLFLQTAGAAALFIFALGGPVAVSAALAQNADTNGRLTRIENEIQTLSRAIFKGQTPPAGAFSGGGDSASAMASTMDTRLSQIERDLQSLTGRVEEMSYDINRLKSASGQQAQPPMTNGGLGMQDSISPNMAQTAPGYPSVGMASANVSSSASMGGGAMGNAVGGENYPSEQYPMDPNAPASATSAPSMGQLGSMSSTPDSPTAAYETAFAMLRNQDYDGAQMAFDSFIKANPNHALIPNAMYWLGETYYVRNDFQKAVHIFAESYQKYPKGTKAPDNLLKLALSLNGMGKTADACVALAQLKKEYPAGAAPVLTRADQESAKLGCKS